MVCVDCKLGLSIHQTALDELARIEAKFEEDQTWVSEVLEGALATMKAPDVQLLPKTPSMKRARRTRKPANSRTSTNRQKTKESPKTDSPSQSMKKTRRTRKAGDSQSSTGSATEDSSTTDSLNQSAGRPQRNCRKKPANSTRVTRTTRKAKAEECVIITDEMEKSIQEPIPEESEETEEDKESPAQESSSQEEVTPQKKKVKITIATPDKNSPRNTPCRVAGYMSLNVKDKAKAFEQHCRNSHTPKRLQSPSVASSHDEEDAEMTEPAEQTFTASPRAATRRSSIRRSARRSGLRRSSVSRRSSLMRHQLRKTHAIVEHTKQLLLKKAVAAAAAVASPRVRHHLVPASPNKPCTRSKSRKPPTTECYESPRLRAKRAAQPSECLEEAKRACKQSFTPNSGGTFSFLKRNTPMKSSQTEFLEIKRKEVEAKAKKAETLLQKRNEMLHRQQEERRKRNEERQMLAAKRREEQISKDKQLKKQQNQRHEDKRQLTQQLLASKVKEEKEKARIRDQKLAEAEQKRQQEEEQRIQRLKENEREAAMLEELAARRKEHEDQERQRKLAEQRKAHEQHMAALQKEKEAVRLRQVEEIRLKEEEAKQREIERLRQRERDLKRQQKEREEKEQREKEAVRQKQQEEIRRKEEEARLRTERERNEMERLKMREVQRQQNEQEDREQEQREREEEERKAAEMRAREEKRADTYDMTPVRKEYSKKATADNYNIDDIRSDDSTDDDTAPRKKIPDWAQGNKLKIYLINQTHQPPPLDEIFGEIDSPDLNKLFSKRKPRFNKRTSSAVWTTPMYKPSGQTIDEEVEASTCV